MSSEITVARQQQYSDAVRHLSQQKGSRLRGLVRQETQQGKSKFFDRIGKRTATKITSRHADTVYTDTPHSRRRVTLVDYADADLIDEQDRIRMLWDPNSPYVQAQGYAVGRAMDDEIIEKALGIAYSGEEGGTQVALSIGQRRVAVAASAGANLNLKALRDASQILDANEVPDDMPRYWVCASSQIHALLGDSTITSADYNSVKALVDGNINSFMGFQFIKSERLPTLDATAEAAPTSYEDSFDVVTGVVASGSSGDATGYRRTFAFAGGPMGALLFSDGLGQRSRVEEIPGKNYSTQVHTRASFGSVRMEEEQLVEVMVTEA
jgi:hypothetical protein